MAVTRHGQTVVYFIPAQGQGQVDAHVAALRKASQSLDKLLAARSIDAEDRKSVV